MFAQANHVVTKVGQICLVVTQPLLLTFNSIQFPVQNTMIDFVICIEDECAWHSANIKDESYTLLWYELQSFVGLGVA